MAKVEFLSLFVSVFMRRLSKRLTRNEFRRVAFFFLIVISGLFYADAFAFGDWYAYRLVGKMIIASTMSLTPLHCRDFNEQRSRYSGRYDCSKWPRDFYMIATRYGADNEDEKYCFVVTDASHSFYYGPALLAVDKDRTFKLYTEDLDEYDVELIQCPKRY